MEKKWFVAKTRAKQERSVQRKIEEKTNAFQLDVDTFLPLRTEIHNWKDRKKKVECVLIPNTIFIHTDEETLYALANQHFIQMSFLRDYTNQKKNAVLVVSDRQMENFMAFLRVENAKYEVEERALYLKGDRVIITQGPMKGIVGELVRIDNMQKIAIRIDSLIACTVELPSEAIERVAQEA